MSRRSMGMILSAACLAGLLAGAQGPGADQLESKARSSREAAALRIQKKVPAAAQQFRRDLKSYLNQLDVPRAMRAPASAAAVAAEVERARYRNPYFRSGEERRSANGVLDTSLVIGYAERKIWRPETLKTNGTGTLVDAAGNPLPDDGDPVVTADPGVISARLRSYEGMAVGPTLRVKPGEILRVKLKNQLPAEDPSKHPEDVNIPHGFNRTNLHTHGLHVSPVGNGDNVLLEVNPGEEFISEVPVPEDHIPGTFWYHAHLHGSTAMQVSSGMAGALIIDAADDDSTAVDNVPGIKTAEERICLFQQISYLPKPAPNYELKLMPALSDPGGLPAQGQAQVIIGRINQKLHFRIFDDKGVQIIDRPEADLIGKASDLARLTERLDAINWPPAPTPEQQTELVAAVWSVVGLTTYELEDFNPAFTGRNRWIDGKRSKGWRTTVNGQLQPVIRVKSGQLQRFRFIHAGIREPITVQFAPIPENVIAGGDADRLVYDVDALNDELMREFALDGIPLEQMRKTKSIELFPGYRSDALVRLTNTTAAVQHYVMWDGPNEVSLDPSSLDSAKEAGVLAIIEVLPGDPADEEPWPTLHDFSKVKKPAPISPHDVFGLQTVQLQLPNATTTPPTRLGINGQPYHPDNPPMALKLGRTDEWRLSANAANHPFHIHVNPFYVVSRTDKNTDGSVTTTPIGVWKDTLLVQAAPPGGAVKETFYTILTNYRRYIGDFVLHCHILDHEDTGMMIGVSIRNAAYDVGTKLANPYEAPKWTLPDAMSMPRHLTDLMGSEATILVFLERQTCTACNAQLEAFRSREAKFPDRSKVNVVFVAPKTKEPSFPAPDFPFPVVFDEDLTQFELYGAYVPLHKTSLHGTFILDKAGQVRWREISETPYMNVDQLLREIEEIKKP